MKPDISLELCKAGNVQYKAIRSRHYVPDNGTVGRSLSYLIRFDGTVIGIITGGSCASAVRARDEFFGLDLVNQFDDYYSGEHEGMMRMRSQMLGSIINNTIFRLEVINYGLASAVLARWRVQVVADWNKRYGEMVLGFETYILETPNRNGGCYVADNWTKVGQTSTGKLIYCKLNDNLFSGECLNLMNYEIRDLLDEMRKRAKSIDSYAKEAAKAAKAATAGK
jgi:hypothetical protein